MVNTDRLETISPEHAAFASGITTAALGGWRGKRRLDGIGTRVGREYVYSRDDVLAHIAPLAFLARYGLGLPRALEVVKSHADAIKAAVRDSQGDDLVVLLSLRTSVPGLDGTDVD